MDYGAAGFVIAIVGTCCGFMYWMLSALEKRLEKDIHAIAEDMKDQRKRTDQLYEILINLMKEKSPHPKDT